MIKCYLFIYSQLILAILVLYIFVLFQVSHKSALESMFRKLRLNISPYYLKEYTSARGPTEFCNDIESLPEKIIILNKHGKLEETINPKYIKPSPSVYQETTFQADPNYQFVSSSSADKPVRDFDLNQIPPDEAE